MSTTEFITFDSIFRKYGSYIYNYSMKLALRPEDAQDLAQETFVKAWEKREQLKNPEAVSGWLRKICYTQFLMNLRKQDPSAGKVDNLEELEVQGKQLSSYLPGPEDEVIVLDHITRMQNGCFYAMARKLSLPQRIAFSMVDMFGLSVSECADLMEISEGAVKGLLHRARMNLDTFFGGHCNLINSSNPCSCEGWINFQNTHDSNQIKMRANLEKLSYKENQWHFDESVRKKVQFLYSNIPPFKPADSWYDEVIKNFS